MQNNRNMAKLWFLGPVLGLAAALGLSSTADAKSSIVGGHSVSITEAPWQLLFKVDEGGGLTGMCGAVWIGKRWAITAAHCVENATPANASIYAGITREREATDKTRVHVLHITANPEFPDTWKDIAVLELASDITSPLAKPVAFATPADVKMGLTSPGVEIRVTGWGGTNRNGELADSLQMLKTTIHDTDRYTIKIAADGSGIDRGACGGDSGGPFVVRDATGTGWIVAGLSSYITSYCGDPKSPSSYSRVSAFASWIQQNTGYFSVGTSDGQPGRQAFFTAPGRFRIQSAQAAELAILNLNGAVVRSERGVFAAGEHAAPVAGLAPGPYILRLQGQMAGGTSVQSFVTGR
jgi:secreted trypsin-like serine protease